MSALSTTNSSAVEVEEFPGGEKVAALYHFARIENTTEIQQELLKLCKVELIKGTLILAHEGINGTIAGPVAGIDKVITFIRNMNGFDSIHVKYSSLCNTDGFHHMRIKLKSEIVTMGKPNIDPLLSAGTYVDPKDWNALINRKDVMVIDTRNSYEVHIGKFKDAVNPETSTFRDFPEWADNLIADKVKTTEETEKTPPVALAMYCTGGIRCEKATVYMKQLGIQEVYHLKGGILKYLEEVPKSESLWEGECFVFDERVALKHDLQPGSYTRCYACKMPLSAEDVSVGPLRHEEGVYCTYCVDKQTEAQRERFRERQRQVLLARERGEEHVGQQQVVIGKRKCHS